MSDLMLGTIIGAVLLALVLSALAAVLLKLGLVHFGYGRAPAPPPPPPADVVRKPYPRIGCSLMVEEKAKHSPGLKPHLRLFAIVDNEGEVAVRSLKGYWKVVTPDNQKCPPIPIQREVLAPQDKYLESYLLSDDLDTQAAAMRFDVEVEFDYQALDDQGNRHFSGKFRYDRKTHRMVKIN
jgi:hypothetical protein